MHLENLGWICRLTAWSTEPDGYGRKVIVLPAFACLQVRRLATARLFFHKHAHTFPKVFSYTARGLSSLRTCQRGLLAHWHDSTHTSGRATGGLFYIKQYGNTPTGRKMSNKDTRALPCYYAITYHPFLRPPFNPLRTVVRALCILRTVGYIKQENTV